MNRPLLAGLGVAAFLASAGFPLATYSLTLALFGAAHVLYELRYVDRRFGPGLGRVIRWGMGLLLLGIVGLRAAGVWEWLPYDIRGPGELLLGAGLVGLALPALAGAGVGVTLVGVGLAGALVLAMIQAPLYAFLTLSVLHNFTPLGFLAERLRGPDRIRALGVGALVFVGGPLCIASGLPARWLGGLVSAEWTMLPTGPLSAHLGTYLPRGWFDSPRAADLFGGIVFAQCMHYVAVIYVLPRLGAGREPDDIVARPGRDRPIVPWPRSGLFLVGVIVATLPLLAFYAVDFAEARALYAIAASVHAWIEIPILLLALAAAYTEG